MSKLQASLYLALVALSMFVSGKVALDGSDQIMTPARFLAQRFQGWNNYRVQTLREMANSRQRPTRYHRASRAASDTVGHATALAVVATGVVVWMGVGVWTSFPTEWLLVTNLSATVLVFLLLLLLRHSQQMHMRSIHTKLNELIRTGEGGNHLIGSERLADDMLDELRTRHRELAAKDPN